jgi:hypothetical protein
MADSKLYLGIILSDHSKRKLFEITSKRCLFYGCECDMNAEDRAKGDQIISDDPSMHDLGSGMYSMVLMNMLNRMYSQTHSDKATTEEQKKDIRDHINVLFGLTLEKDSHNEKFKSTYEIGLQEQVKMSFLEVICSSDDIDNEIRVPMIDYCVSACPYVSNDKRGPIFVVQHRDGRWYLNQYDPENHPDRKERQMFFGVPYDVMSSCGLLYHVVLFNRQPVHVINVDVEDSDEDLKETDSV